MLKWNKLEFILFVLLNGRGYLYLDNNYLLYCNKACNLRIIWPTPVLHKQSVSLVSAILLSVSSLPSFSLLSSVRFLISYLSMVSLSVCYHLSLWYHLSLCCNLSIDFHLQLVICQFILCQFVIYVDILSASWSLLPCQFVIIFQFYVICQVCCQSVHWHLLRYHLSVCHLSVCPLFAICPFTICHSTMYT